MPLQKHDVNFEIKSVEDSGTFSGFGAIFDTVDQVKDVIEPGAFTKSLGDWQSRKRFPPVLWAHDADQPIGVYTAMEEQKDGLWVEGKLLVDKIGKAREVHALMEARAVDGLSIGYSPLKHSMKGSVRHLNEVKLFEVSIVTFPAHLDARVLGVKQRIQEALENGEYIKPSDWEKLLRDAGLSKSQATAFVSHGFKGLARSDSANDDITQALNILKGA